MMKSTRPEVPTAVVAEDLSRDNVPLRKAWCGKLRDQRRISWAIGKVAKLFPGMSHLKRCSSKRLVLGFVSDSPEASEDRASSLRYTRQEIIELLAQVDFDLTLFEDNDLELLEVPAVAARTKVQAKFASAIWPLNFHPDPHLERILNGTCFDAKQRETIDRCTKLCIEVALRGKPRGTRDCHGSAVVYDPSSDRILALAASRVDLHPMWHASMIAVDLVARIGSGGAYRFIDDDQPRHDTIKCPRIDDRGQSFPLAFPRDLHEIARRIDCEDKPPTNTYLCTDYWIFLLREPCPLCAMALLHSRVANIFYGVANEARGVLGTRALLHDLPGLNHRYGVWKGVREAECRAAFVRVQEAQAAQE